MDLLIAVLTLFAAIYALVPRGRQLDIQVRVGVLDVVIASIASIFILYLEFNEFCSSKGWVLRQPWPTGITPKNTSYLVLHCLLTPALDLRFYRVQTFTI